MVYYVKMIVQNKQLAFSHKHIAFRSGVILSVIYNIITNRMLRDQKQSSLSHELNKLLSKRSFCYLFTQFL